MARKNDEVTSMAVVFAIIGTLVAYIGVIITGLLLVVSFVYFVVSLCAWNREIEFLGDTIRPDQARAYVIRGIVGAVGLPAFTAFLAMLFGLQVRQEVWGWFWLFGFVGGSLGIQVVIEWLEYRNQKNRPAQDNLSRPVTPPVVPPPLPPAPFHYASWDDEEELR